MSYSDKYRVVGDTETPDINDVCVCNAYIGALFVGTTNRIFTRVDESDPCNVNDWIELDQSAGYSYSILADDTNTKVVASGNTLTFDGINGLSTTISGNTVAFNGHLYATTANPSSAPSQPSQMSLHLNVLTNGLYLWNPNTSTWVSFSQNVNGISYDPNTYVLSLTGGSGQTIATATLTPNLSEDANNALELRANGLYVPQANITPSLSANADNILSLDGDDLLALETVTTLVDNTGSFTYTSEDGTVTNIDLSANLTLDNASQVGADRVVSAVSIVNGELLINAAYLTKAEGYTEANDVLNLTPIPQSALNQATITLDVVNPSSDKPAKAFFIFTGYPITVLGGDTADLLLQIQESIKVNGVTPTDYVNHVSEYRILDNMKISARTQGYSGIIDLSAGQTVQVEVQLSVFF